MSAAEKLEIRVIPAEWFRQELMMPTFGIKPEAARKYRDRGIWLEGTHWKKDPVGRIVYNRDAISSWLGGQV